VFISDLHLGTPGCKADCLLDFLQHVESDYLYLIGDVVDGWRLKKKWFWPERHRQVLQALLARQRRGTRVVYLPGNHDEALRKRLGRSFAGVRVVHDAIHRTADGRLLLVVHGDTFDGVCTGMPGSRVWARSPTTPRCGSTPASTSCAAGSASAIGPCRRS
jgi:UDP-2,3-diacylglucosamine pyrophosphatase LpxH